MLLQDKVDSTRSRAERVVLASQDKQEVLKLTQEIRFAIEVAMVSLIYLVLILVAHHRPVRCDHREQGSDPSNH